MIPLPLAVVSATPATTTVIAADNGAKRAEAGDDFAALLGIQVAVAAGEAKPGPAIARTPLPKSGKTLPDPADAAPETAEPATPEVRATDEPVALPLAELSAPPTAPFALAVAAAIAPVAAEAVTVAVTVTVSCGGRTLPRRLHRQLRCQPLGTACVTDRDNPGHNAP